MFSFISKPVSAVYALDDVVAYVMVTLCTSLMIGIATDNPNTGQELINLFNYLSDGAQRAVVAAANTIQYGASTVYNWEVETFKNLTTEIRGWFSNNYVPVIDYGLVLPTNDDNYIGFTSDTYFQMYFPDNVDTCIFFLPNSLYYVYDNISASSLLCYGSDIINDSNCGSDTNIDCQILTCNSGLDWYYWTTDNSRRSSPKGQFIYPYTSSIGSYSFDCNTYSTNYFKNGWFYDRNTSKSYIVSSTSNGYGFVCTSDNSVYQGLYFVSDNAAVDWFLNECGLCTARYSERYVYEAPAEATNVFDYDSDKTDAAKDYIDSLEGETVSTVLPGTKDQAKALVDNPSAVWDVSVVDFDGSINLPSVDSSVWFDKFPFCVPFDFIKLFSSFTAEAEAPKFHILVLPANSFGLSNDDIYWDIDFTDYDYLVKILRFFIGISFLAWLIFVTRKLIGAGG